MLSINKLFQFSASHKCYYPDWEEKQNLVAFGKEAKGVYGHGHNFAVAFVFSGEIDQETGMIMEFSQIKEKINKSLIDKFDHKYINEIEPFTRIVPTQENLAAYFFKEAAALFTNENAVPVACHLISSEKRAATAYSSDKLETHWYGYIFPICSVSTILPGQGKELNAVCPMQFKLTLDIGKMDFQEQKYNELIEKYLNQIQLQYSTGTGIYENISNSISMIIKVCFNLFKQKLPLSRLKFSFNDIFVEYLGGECLIVGRKDSFYAVHKLGDEEFSEQEKIKHFGKCRFRHGHEFKLETGIKINLEKDDEADVSALLRETVKNLLHKWDHKCLELETSDFNERISTGEQIIKILANKLENELDYPLYRLRLSETDNNRFCWRPGYG